MSKCRIAGARGYDWKYRLSENPASKHRKHTPIVSEKQRGFFGSELARKREGKETRTDISEADLVAHLEEVGGKKLPKKAKKRGKK